MIRKANQIIALVLNTLPHSDDRVSTRHLRGSLVLGNLAAAFQAHLKMMNSDTKRKPAEDGKPGSENNLMSTPVPAGGSVGGISQLSPVGSVGRIKEPPVCRAESLTKESLSCEQLSTMCWNAPFDPFSSSNETPDKRTTIALKESASVASSSSKAHNALSLCNPSVETDPNTKQQFPRPAVFKRMTSRTGRETQRWATDTGTNQLFRLVTGTVPIMTDGRILFCSSSRKQEWILPKGGWEADETMEESALRETFEEAGVFGTLGPKLDEVEYETRKAKKRRLEREERIKKYKEEAERTNSDAIATSKGKHGAIPSQQPLSSAVVSVQSHSSCGASSDDEQLAHSSVAAVPEDAGNDSASNDSPLIPKNGNASDGPTSVSVASQSGINRDSSSNRSSAGHQNDDTASVASAASGTSDASTSCAHVRMSLFPLYVSEVRDEWPESGRARKVMDIDAAIKMMEPRPEFRAVLVEVKKKGLHLKLTTSTDNTMMGGDLGPKIVRPSVPANGSI